MAKLENFYPLATRIKRRPGTLALTTTAYDEVITSLFPYTTTVGTWTLIAGALTGIAKLDGMVLVLIPKSGGGVYTSVTTPWLMKQYKGVFYAVRANTGSLKRSNGVVVSDAGISAPASAPTIAQVVGGGSMEAGTRKCVYTYRNSTTGAESNPSDPSNEITLSANDRVDVSAMVNSTDPQVDKKVVYFSLPNQSSEYYEASIIDNFDLTVSNVDQTITQLGDRASFRNGTPPSLSHLMEIFQERMFLSDGTSVKFSETGKVESYFLTSSIDVFPDDGHSVVALHAFGSRLIVGKSNAVHYITGTGLSTFKVSTLAERDGCASGSSMQSGGGFLFWFTGSKVVISQGVSPKDISEPIRDLIERINPDAWDKIVGSINTRLSLYFLDVPLDSATSNTHRLAFNYESGAWSTFRYNSSVEAPSVSHLVYDSDTKEQLYGAFPSSNHLYNLLSGTTDDGAAITAIFRTKAFGFGHNAMRHLIRYVKLLIDPQVASTILLGLYQDLQTTTLRTRSISINRPGWIPVSLSSGERGAMHTQLEGTYSGGPEIEVGGLSFKIITLEHHGYPV